MRLLVVEDDASFGAALQRGLELHGAVVTRVRDAGSAYRSSQTTEFDLFIVDWMLPGQDGLGLVGQLRSIGVTAPVIMLTARDAVEDRVRGLDAGADDYLVKPFHLDELLARMRALLRRPDSSLKSRLGLGALVLDTTTRSATLDGKRVDLTPGEGAVLEQLLLHAPGAATRSALSEAIEAVNGVGTASSIDTHIFRLRAKIQSGSVRVCTLRGFGYRIEEHP